MLFQSSLRKDLARSFGASFVVLLTIVMTMMLIRTLGLASRGSVDPQDVMLVLGYTVLGYLPTILTLGLFVAVVSTLSRMYRDSEMVIWFSSGRGLAGFVGPMLRFAWPVLAVVAALSLVIWPWANQQSAELRNRYERRGDLERVTPGQFQESASGARVFFIDKESADRTQASNVFISSSERGRNAVTSARSGRIEIINGQQHLVLQGGQRLDTPMPGSAGARQAEFKVSEFEEYAAVVGDRAFDSGPEPVKSVSTLRLLRENTPLARGELSWRVGLALAAVNMVLVALVLASANPRVGRSGNLLAALFAFITYYNLINLGQSWIAAGRVDAVRYTLALHGGVLALALLGLAARHRQWSWRDLLPARRAKAAA